MDNQQESRLLVGLNERQKEAVLHKDGPMLVLAGAGSGKTRVLTHRIAYMIEQGVAPGSILAVTFTNKAAGEMQERIANLLQRPFPNRRQAFVSATHPFVGTFHSLAVQILRREAGALGYSSDFVIYDSDDQLSAVKKSMKELGISKDDFNPHAVKHAMSQAKNEMQSPSDFARKTGGDEFLEKVQKIYERYQKFLKESNAFDFDDLIFYLVKLFEKNQKALERYQERFRYILIDEYQDTNGAQYALAELLSKKYKNLCVVGDDWQSIYGWRGADIRNILEFEKDYPNAKIVKLEQNYRSTRYILDAAHQVMQGSDERKEKELWTDKGDGEKISLFVAKNAFQEAEFVAAKVHEAKNNGGKLAERAVLYRTNSQSRMLEEMLLKYGIPYTIVGGVRFYDRKEIKDVIAYLRLAVNPHDSIAFIRVVNYPARKIGAKTISLIGEEAQRQGISYFNVIQNDEFIDSLRGAAKGGLREFRTIIAALQKKMEEGDLAAFVEFAAERSGVVDAVRDGSDEGESRYENVLELKSVASRFAQGNVKEDLESLLQEVTLMSDIDQTDEESANPFAEKKEEDQLFMMTVHSAKGLEFDEVFMIGMEESVFPHSRSLFEMKELEEERRLCYVGMTRAKKKLHMVRSEERLVFGSYQQNLPSRFIEEIDDTFFQLISFGAFGAVMDVIDKPAHRAFEGVNEPIGQGDLVQHKVFGRGVVLRDAEANFEIAFAKHGIKKIAHGFEGLSKMR